MKLFCLPYCGASVNVYMSWKKKLAPFVSLELLEYPGRGRKFSQPLCNSMEELIEKLLEQLYDRIKGGPFAFFGHSLGGIVSYKLACRLADEGISPSHLFLSGCLSPNNRYGEKRLHERTDMEFLYEIIKLGGTEQSLYENTELVNIFLPILKTDYKIYETCAPSRKDVVLPVDYTVFTGTNDTITKDTGVMDWDSYTSKSCEYIELSGNHFFLFEHEDYVLKLVNKKLLQYLRVCCS